MPKKIEIEIWSVKERLPTQIPFTFVSAWWSYGQFSSWIIAAYYKKEWTNEDGSLITDGKITHWCELPNMEADDEN